MFVYVIIMKIHFIPHKCWKVWIFDENIIVSKIKNYTFYIYFYLYLMKRDNTSNFIALRILIKECNIEFENISWIKISINIRF